MKLRERISELKDAEESQLPVGVQLVIANAIVITAMATALVMYGDDSKVPVIDCEKTPKVCKIPTSSNQ